MEEEFKDTSNLSNEIFFLEIARVTEVKQQVGNLPDDKRLVCTIEMALGGIISDVPFYGGGVDSKTQFPHGIFAPPRINQLVGVLFLRGSARNPMACFPVPHPSWAFNEVNGKKLYSSIMEDLDDITLFHFSGSRMHFRKDGTFEFAKKIGENKYKMNLKIEDTDKKKTITDMDNNHTVVFKDKSIEVTDSNGNKITMDDNGVTVLDHKNSDSKIEMTADGVKITDAKNGSNVIEMSSNGIKLTDKNNNIATMDGSGIKLQDKNNNVHEMKSSGVKIADLNGNTFEMKAGQVSINGTACEVLT